MPASHSEISNNALVSMLSEATLPPVTANQILESPQPESVPFASLSTEQREAMLLEHMSSVRYIARRIHERLPQHVEMDDLISAGVIGLMDAFTKFDTRKNVQFKSYAQFRIRGAILDSLRDLDWSPRELRRKGRAIEEAVGRLTAQLGRAPLEPEIATEMHMPLEEYHQLLGDLKGLEIGTLHIERNEDAGDDEINYIPGPEQDDPFLQCMKSEMRHRLADAIEELPERERLVLSLYYFEELTMKEIGVAIGVVESRVSQIHSAAVLRLRSSLAGYGTRKLVRRARPTAVRVPRPSKVEMGATA
jgi:RNA polymerase sigma factor for flagellar operon FliA